MATETLGTPLFARRPAIAFSSAASGASPARAAGQAASARRQARIPRGSVRGTREAMSPLGQRERHVAVALGRVQLGAPAGDDDELFAAHLVGARGRERPRGQLEFPEDPPAVLVE